MIAAHASADSLLARCHATGRPPATAISTTAFLRSQIPSRNTASCTSPVKGAIGRIFHAQEVLLQNVDRLTLSSATASLESSQRRKSPSAFASLLILRTPDAPHLGQRHRFVPAFVVPLPFILDPQIGHFGLFTSASCPSATFHAKKLA